MDSLLFLCHRIPYPPNKGDKIRSYHFLQFLAQHYRVYLGTFIDDPADEQHRDKVRGYCADLCAISINPAWRRLLSLRGLVTGEALGLPYYRHSYMRQWVECTLRSVNPARALVFSSTMAQYLLPQKMSTLRTVIDFVDVDSEKWRAYASKKRWPVNLVYQREANRLLDYEKHLAKRAAASVFVSAAEARLFNSLLDAPLSSVSHVDNGVDLAYYRADPTLSNPYPTGVPILVFTGAMDYWANVDAVTWFAATVLPTVRAQMAAAEFWIVGSRPTAEVRELGERSGIRVTGAVPDIRPYLQHARVVVAPLRIARGIQNKVLEGMAMSKMIVGTTAAFEGIELKHGAALRVADDATTFAQTCLELLGPEARHVTADSSRHYVERAHDWQANLQKLRAHLET